MKRKILYSALMIMMIVSMLFITGCGDASNIAGTVSGVAKETQSKSEDYSSKVTKDNEYDETASEEYAGEESLYEEQFSEVQSYVLNTNTKVFHYPDCKSVKLMKDKNKSEVEDTRDNIISWGYKSCGNCNP